MGGMSTMLSLHDIELGKLTLKIEELEQHKASKTTVKALENRVRRKIDGQLKENSFDVAQLNINYHVLANDTTQAQAELKTTWDNYNRLNCK